MSKSANIIPTVFRCAVSFFVTVVYTVVPKIYNFIAKRISGIIGGALRLITWVAISTDLQPPLD